MVHVIKLHPKTLKGCNKINEAGKPEHWNVLEERDFVSFSERTGPWLLVSPDIPGNKDLSRWVSTTNDLDFTVEIVR